MLCPFEPSQRKIKRLVLKAMKFTTPTRYPAPETEGLMTADSGVLREPRYTFYVSLSLCINIYYLGSAIENEEMAYYFILIS